MPHIRVLRHYIHTPLMVLSAAEALVVMLAAYLGYASRYREFPDFTSHLLPAVTLAVVFVSAMIAMGVYESRVREGMTGMSLRTAVALFLLGATVMVILSALIPDVRMGSDVLLFATLEAFILLTAFRLLVFALIHEDTFKKQILILGIGQRALKVASRMRRRVDQRAFVLAGFLDPGSSVDQVSEYGVRIINSDMPLAAYCHEHGVEEVVVAMDERRRNLPQGDGGLPLEELMECRLTGINVCDVQQFIEREACKVDVDLLRPSWLVFSDGFHAGPVRAISKQSFDLLASILLLLIAWPVMLITAIAIKLEAPDQPVLYRQRRLGQDEKPFDVLKFRSMDISRGGSESRWTAYRDPRITRIGAFIRKTRIDELPQLFNVLKGDMSFVGPRPEQPEIIEELKEAIPFYGQRHRVKPGITGWAQLCYPYGASIDDAKEKLQYDLYYLKNHSLLLDMIILLQTVEVVLIGEGAR